MSHRIHQDLTNAVRSAGLISAESGVARVHGKHLGNLTVSGATSLDNVSDGEVGTVIFVRATNTAPLTNRNGTPIDTLANGDARAYQATSTSTWKPLVGAETAADLPIADAGGYTDSTNVEAATQALFATLSPLTPATTLISTVGNGTLTAAAIIGGGINRLGSTAPYTDTTATGEEIIAALGPGAAIGQSWPLLIRNLVAFPQTIAAGASGITISTISPSTSAIVVPPNSAALVEMTYSDVDSVTLKGLGILKQTDLPNINYTTITEAASITAAAGTLTGANLCVYTTTGSVGNTALTTRTAAQMFADTPNAYVGMSWMVRIISDGANTTTLTAGSNVTITGTATVATNTWREFRFIFTSTTALAAQCIGVGSMDSTT
jgi:hypothetical protein